MKLTQIMAGATLAFASLASHAQEETIPLDRRMAFVDEARGKMRSGIKKLDGIKAAGGKPAPAMCDLFWYMAGNTAANLAYLNNDPRTRNEAEVIEQNKQLSVFTAKVEESCPVKPAQPN